MSQTGRHASTQRLRRGTCPDRRRRNCPALSLGNTGPGPGARPDPPIGCQTPSGSVLTRSRPGYIGITGTTGNGQPGPSTLTATAGHLMASCSIRSIASPGSIPPPGIMATPRRPGLSSASVGPSALMSHRLRPSFAPEGPRSITSAVPSEAARPIGPTSDRIGSIERTPMTECLPFPTMCSKVWR